VPRLMIIVGSTRPGRAGLPFARWFTGVADDHGAFTTDLADLAEVGLPLLDEPAHPRLRDYTHEHTRRWSARVDAADAVVMVTPEYNHSFPAPLKNAIDFVFGEWADKPVGFVTYGGASSGTRALVALKPVVTALRMVPVVEAVNIPFFPQFIDDDGTVTPNQVMSQAAVAMLDELARMEALLRPARAAR